MSMPKRSMDGLTVGEWLERRKNENRCLACGARLSYRFDSNRDGFLNDFCIPCLPNHKPPPRQSQKNYNRQERKRGVETLDRLLNKKI